MKYACTVFIGIAMIASPVFARDSLGVFGDWGAFRERGACYAIAAPTRADTGKRSDPYITVSQFTAQGTTPQVMVAAGTAVRSVSVRAGGQGFKPIARNDAAWMPDSRGDQLLIQAFQVGNSINVDITTARGNRLRDQYSLNGFGDAWKAAQVACK